jgi:hypothetical protein
MSEYKTETTLLPDPKVVTVLMQQKSVTLESGLTIDSYFVREGSDAPFVVSVVGNDASIEAGKTYMLMLRERKQTRATDGREFIELQVAGAQEQ